MEPITNQSIAESSQQHEKIRPQISLYKSIRVLYRVIPYFILMKLFKNTSTIKMNLTPFFANTHYTPAFSHFKLLFKVLDSWKSSSKNLALDFSRCGVFEIRYAKKLSQRLQKFIALESLNFNFSYSSSLTPKCIDALSFNFSKQKSLKKLHFNWSQCAYMNQESIAKLLRNIKRSNSLSHLNMDFSECPNFDGIALQVLSNNLTNHKNLQALILRFHLDQKLDPQGLKSLAKNLKHLSKLTRLNLKFSKLYKTLDQGFYREFFKSLKAMKNLQDLSLDLSCLQTTIKGGEENPFGMLQENTQLRNLKIILDYFVGSLEPVIDGLSQSFPKLEKLEYIELQFCQVRDLNDSSIKSLCEGLIQMKSLKELNLGFPQCRELTDASIESLIIALKEVKSLEKLTLNIQLVNGISRTADRKLRNNLKDIEVKIR